MEYGEIIDVPFPTVDPQGDEGYIEGLAERYLRRILQLHPYVVLCQGEFCLAYRIITKLHESGIMVLAACSERVVKEAGQKKEVMFAFSQFRRYCR